MRIRYRLAVATLACLVASPGKAGISTQVPIGPRAIALGGAYSALADDASAIFWNPAGLAGIGHQEIAGSYANLYAADIKDSYLAFVLPVSSGRQRRSIGTIPASMTANCDSRRTDSTSPTGFVSTAGSLWAPLPSTWTGEPTLME